MSDNNTLFYIGIGSLAFAVVGLILKYAFKSKCTRVSLCCGFFECIRNTQLEEKLDELKIEHNIKTEDSDNNLSIQLGALV